MSSYVQGLLTGGVLVFSANNRKILIIRALMTLRKR